MTDAGDWAKQEALADESLNKPEKIIFVEKQGTRLGATTSIIKRALERGLKVTSVEPYHTINQETIKNAAILAGLKEHEIGHLLSVQKMCPRHRKYRGIPLAFKGNCNSCDIIHCCPYQIWLNTNYKLTTMTYAKLMIINKYASEDVDLIKQKILSSDVIFLDEFSHGVHVAPYEIDVSILDKITSKIEDNINLFFQPVFLPPPTSRLPL